MPPVYDRRPLVIDRNPLVGLSPDPAKLPKLDAAALWGQWLDGLKRLTGLDLSSPEGLVQSLGELITSGLGLDQLAKMFGFVDIPGTVEQLGEWLRPHLFGQIPSWRLGNIPAAHIGNFNPELLDDPGFDFESTIASNPSYEWDGAVGRGSSIGSARTTADGTTRFLRSNRFEVSPGQKLSVKAYAYWQGLTYASGAGGPIRLSVTLYDGDAILGSYVVSSISPVAADAADWALLAGEYQIPSGSAATHAAVMLTVDSSAAAGSVWFDDGSARKVGLIAQELIAGLQAAIQARIDEFQSVINKGWEALTGLPASINKTVEDWKLALQNIPQANVKNLGVALAGAGQDIRDAIVQALGGSGTGHTALDVLHALGNIPQHVVNGLEDELADAGDAIADVFDDVRDGWRKWLSALTGQAEDSGANAQKNADQLAALMATLAANTAALTALETNLNPDGGVHGGDLFERDDLTGIDPGWAVVNEQPPSTHGTYILTDGQAQWDMHGSAPSLQSTVCVRTDPADAKTATAYQLVTRVIGTQVMHSNAHDYILGRVSDDRLSYVYADFYSAPAPGFDRYFYVQLRYRNNGVIGDLGSPSMPLIKSTPGMRHTLVCGTAGGERVYQVLRNGSPILTVTDSGNVTNVAPDCRGWGFGGVTGSYLSSQVAPSAVAAITVDDNDPAAITGTTFRAYRGTATQTPDISHPTGAIDAVSSSVALPNNTFTVTDYITSDLVWNPTTGELGITKAGTYLIGVRYQFAEAGDQYPLVFVNGSRRVWIGGVREDSGQVGHGSTAIHLAAGDVIRFGVALNATGRNLLGDAAGMSCYVTATRIG